MVSGGTSSGEQRVALIPRYIREGTWGDYNEYGILFTDKRMIFVLTVKDHHTFVGYVWDELTKAKGIIDYANDNLDELSKRKGNFAIANQLVKKVKIKKKLGAHKMWIRYADDRGKKSKLIGMLDPPKPLVEEKRKEKVSYPEIYAEYAKKTREVFEKVLPMETIQNSEWSS